MVALPLHEKTAFDPLDDDADTPRRPSPARLAILLLLLVGIVRVAFLDPLGVAGWSTSLMTSEGTVTHIVMFQFRDGVNRDVMAEVRSLPPPPNLCDAASLADPACVVRLHLECTRSRTAACTPTRACPTSTASRTMSRPRSRRCDDPPPPRPSAEAHAD